MGIEEKAKAYDEALERFKSFKERYYTRDTNLGDVIFDKTGEMQKDFEEIFPQLRESEDERIRKALICGLSEGLSEHNWQGFGGATIDECLAYLEKQKEQKPAEYLDKDKVYATMKKLHKLAFSQLIPINSDEYKKIDEITCDIRNFLNYPIEQKPISQEDFDTAKHEALWEEQKPAECLKADRDGWYVCIKDFYAGGKKQCSVGDLVQAKGGMYMMGREDISEWFRKAYYEEVRNAFAPNADTNIPEPKPAWSEEDERRIDAICELLENTSAIHPNYSHRKLIIWLKDLRPQPKQEWSDEDEEMITRICANLEYLVKEAGSDSILKGKLEERIKWMNRLKSLRSDSYKNCNSRWKPSEEQMEALLWCVAHLGGADRRVLAELYEHLKMYCK